jgi:hypothetical protein
MAGQVRIRSPPEYILATTSKLRDVEIAQVRDLVVERRSIRHRRTDHHARHGTQAARRREGPLNLLAVDGNSTERSALARSG